MKIAPIMPRRKNESEFVPITIYQKWLWPALERRGYSIAELARAINKDYNYIWKIAKGDPAKNGGQTNIPVSPGFDVAKAIGAAVGDVIGSLEAAGFEVADILGGRVLTIATPSGEKVQVIVPSEYTPDMERALAISVESALLAVARRN